MTDKILTLIIKACDWIVGKDDNIDRSDLDESENVFGEEQTMTDTVIYIIFIATFILMMLLDILKIKSNNKVLDIKEKIYQLETDIMQKTLDLNLILVNTIKGVKDKEKS